MADCLYMMVWEPDCSATDDAVDWGNIAQFLSDDIPDDCLVLTI